MQAAIFFQCLLIIALLVILLLRQRILVTPNNEWAVISENFTKGIWNETVELENRFQQNPLFQLPDSDNDPNRLRAAFEQSARIAVEVGDGIRQRSFYGVPVPVEAYCSRAARWYFDIARHYEAWAQAIEADQQTPASNPTQEVAMGAVKGAIRGFLGGWTEVLSMIAEPDTPAETPEARRTEALQSDSSRLNYARAYLNSERASVQAFLGSTFNWQFDENA